MSKAFAEPLERRCHLAASPIDTGWHFDPALVDRAAGTHVTLDGSSIRPTFGGRTLLLGNTSASGFVVRLNEDGTLDTNFGHGGVTNPGLGQLGGSRQSIVSDALGYTYLVTAKGIARLRANGRRDFSYGDGGVATRVTNGTSSYALDVRPDDAGGLDVLQLVDTHTAQLVHLSTTGSLTAIWQGRYDGNGNATKGPSAAIEFGRVIPITGGYAVITSRQFRGQNPDPSSSFDADTGGDATVAFLKTNGKVTASKTFDSGVLISDAVVGQDGRRVTLTYAGTRQVRLVNRVSFHRSRLAVAPTPGLNGKQLAVTFNAAASGGQATSATLINADGTPDTTFGRRGVASLDAVVPKTSPFASVDSASNGQALISYLVGLVDKHGRAAGFETNLLRVWTTNGPVAKLQSTRIRSDGRAFVTVRYRAEDGVARRSLNSKDLLLLGARHRTYGLGVFSSTLLADGGIDVTYVASGVTAGTYSIALLGGQVAAIGGTVNNAADLGRLVL